MSKPEQPEMQAREPRSQSYQDDTERLVARHGSAKAVLRSLHEADRLDRTSKEVLLRLIVLALID